MLQKKIRESLTARIFLITTIILLGAGAITFGLIALATPSTYTAVINDDLIQYVDTLAVKLEDTALEDCGPVLDDFIRKSGADAVLVGPDEQIVDISSRFVIQSGSKYREETMTEDGSSVFAYGTDGAETKNPAAITISEESAFKADADAVSAHFKEEIVDTSSPFVIQSGGKYSEETMTEDGSSIFTYATGGAEAEDAAMLAVSEQSAIATTVRFADQSEPYALYVTPRLKAENLAVRALIQIAPWLLLTLLVFSLLCALAYSRYITKPIVRLSGIAGKMADLDFGWTCEETRQDEIGYLGRSLNQMAQKLSGALHDLKVSNESLRGEVEQERELDRQRMAFFSAASHELKTPVTILKGQLSGMLDGVDVYQDREKYLARSLQVTARMENLIQEILTISRMEAHDSTFIHELTDLSEITKQQLELDAELIGQRNLKVTVDLCSDLMVHGERSMLAKAIGNLLSNAALYSPEGGEIRVWSGVREDQPTLTIENTGVHIGAESLPHLFEAFYREEQSRNRRTGGSGLGLYLVQIILERHGAKCRIENTQEGVQATICFDASK